MAPLLWVAVDIYTLCEYPVVDHTQMEDGMVVHLVQSHIMLKI